MELTTKMIQGLYIVETLNIEDETITFNLKSKPSEQDLAQYNRAFDSVKVYEATEQVMDKIFDLLDQPSKIDYEFTSIYDR